MKQERIHWKKPFFTIVLGQTVSLVGSSAVQFALIWWLATQTSSPMVMALSGLAALLPHAILGPFAGVWVDRMKRKVTVIAADLFMGTAALIFSVFFMTGTPPYWSVFAVLAVRALGSVFHTPAIQSVVPMLVPREALVKANGWSQFMQSGAFMLGPVLGAIMYGILPMSVILITDFVGAVVAAAAVMVVEVPEPEKQDRVAKHFLHEMKDGFSVCIRDRELAMMLLTASVSMIFFMPLTSLYPLMTSDYFQGTAFHASAVEFLYAAGMMAASFVMGTLGQAKHHMSGAYVGLITIGATALFGGMLPQSNWAFWVFAVLCGIMGAGGTIYNIMSVSAIQDRIPHEAQGRVFSLVGSILSFTMPVGLLMSGPVAERYGVARWFLIAGAVVTVLSGLVMMIEQHKKRRKKNEVKTRDSGLFQSDRNR